MSKKILLISDLHCGNEIGLTPPRLWGPVGKRGSREYYVRRLNEEVWKWYTEDVCTLKPDVVICVGDLIDGNGKRNGGREQINPDMIDQSYLASDCLKMIGGTPTFCGVGGTNYHTGTETDFEKIIAEELGFKHYGNHFYPKIDGVVFDVKHHIGNSGVPYGKASALLKTSIIGDLRAFNGVSPKADIVVRGHTHNGIKIDTPRPPKQDKILIKLPAVQGPGTDYGERRCDGEVHIGCAIVTIDDDGKYSAEMRYADIDAAKKRAVKI